MKKKLVLAVIATSLLFTMAACTGNTDSITDSNTGSEQTTAADDNNPDMIATKATPTVSSAEEVAPTEEPEPVEESNPYVIDGFDFTYFYENKHFIDSWVAQSKQVQEIESIHVVAVQNSNIEAVLKNGDKFTCVYRENGKHPGVYHFYVLTPQSIKSYEVGPESEDIITLSYIIPKDSPAFEHLHIQAMIKDGVTGIDNNATITVTYSDDTQETMTFYFTKDYVTE